MDNNQSATHSDVEVEPMSVTTEEQAMLARAAAKYPPNKTSSTGKDPIDTRGYHTCQPGEKCRCAPPPFVGLREDRVDFEESTSTGIR